MTRRKTFLKIGSFGRVLLPLGIAAAAVGFGMQATWASDHADTPSLTADPTADIADVFAFMHPTIPGRMVMTMSVYPSAPNTATFSTGVEYGFAIIGYNAFGFPDPSQALAIVSCRFEAPQGNSQVVLCSVNGISAYGMVGDVDAGGADASDAPLRIYAGLRADPAFGDIAKLQQTLTTKTLSFSDAGDGGTNSFAGKNVLAIVVELDLGKTIFLDDAGPTGTRPLLMVSAATQRLK